jgi:nucleoside-diphosphate-sugar epimerase
MTRVAVTGASGFVGRYVLAALSKTDADVVAHSRVPISQQDGVERLRWTHFDLADVPFDAFDRLHRPDVVIHLVWGGLPNYLSFRHSQVELPAQLRFLRVLIASGLKTLVISGTCFEYGMQSGCLNEDVTPAPSTPYGAAKNALRREIELLNDVSPFDLRWARLFYLYGGGQAANSLYSQFKAAVVRGDKQFDMSTGDQLRDFMKVEDAAAAIADVALAPRAPRIVNICSGAPKSVRHLVEQWRADMAADIALNPGALKYPSYEPFAFWGDNSRLAALPPRTDPGLAPDGIYYPTERGSAGKSDHRKLSSSGRRVSLTRS